LAEQIPDQQGRLRIIETAAPVVAVDLIIVQEPRVRWRFHSLMFLFTTDANAADRFMRVEFTVDTTVVLILFGRAFQTAGLVRRWLVSTVDTVELNLNQGGRFVMAPADLLLNNETEIATNIGGMQAGDQVQASQLIVEEWIEPLL